jgi:hypothetical protein
MPTDAASLTIALTLIGAFAFFFGSVFDAVTHENGFGPTGNTLLFGAGFLAAVYLANRHGLTMYNPRLMVAYGLGGAFALISVLTLLKAGLARR